MSEKNFVVFDRSLRKDARSVPSGEALIYAIISDFSSVASQGRSAYCSVYKSEDAFWADTYPVQMCSFDFERFKYIWRENV